jgi:hypothetical protein
LTTALPALPIGAGATAALAAVARPKANAALKAIVLIIMCTSPSVQADPERALNKFGNRRAQRYHSMRQKQSAGSTTFGLSAFGLDSFWLSSSNPAQRSRRAACRGR